jgi:ectoine hydroxylase-related dioxygenase (phytanoyl-CoA dioxygenase family)
VLDALTDRGIIDLVHELSPRPLRQPNVGCNLNLPGSSSQNEHVDGYAAEPFLVINVAAVDTDLSNGAMEILSGTHRREYQYWEVMFERPERRRLLMKQGDVVIRSSTLWHRGMANRSPVARPMLAFTWEDGGSELADPYAVHGGRITLLPNRHPLDWKGRLRERAYVTAPRVGTAFRVAQSLVASLASR